MLVGIDVGGTNLKAGLVDREGRLLTVERSPLCYRDPEDLAARLARLAVSAAERGGVAPEALEFVGIGIPGVARGEELVYTCNIPMRDVPLGAMFRRHLDVQVALENDANCAAVGEWLLGAGRGSRNFVMLTLGTGIGGGLILDGKLYTGGGIAGEVGHMVICQDGWPCNCGRHGCWETYASATGLIRQTRMAMEKCPGSLLHKVAAENGAVDGRTAFQAAQRGDETALEVCRAYGAYLALGVVNLVNILQPEVLAIGGGIADAPEELLLEPLRETVARECYARHGGGGPRILRAELGNDAGVIGAALLSRAI